MKRYLKLSIILLSVISLSIACQREQDALQVSVNNPVAKRAAAARIASVSIHLTGEGTQQDADGTKSVVSAGFDNFQRAYIFAFHPDGSIYTYIDAQGNEMPIAIYTEDKNFEWALPVGPDDEGHSQQMDIYAVVNPLQDQCEILDDYVNNVQDCGISMTVASLEGDALMYVCSDYQDLSNIEESGIPMSGIKSNLVLQSQSDPVEIKLRRLFAKYELKINTSRFAADGWDIHATKVSAKGNTEVPFFYTGDAAGFSQTDPDKLAAVDVATLTDINTINDLNESNKSVTAITLYMLENCHGTPSFPAEHWYSVSEDLGDEVALCSYIEFVVLATKTGYGDRSFVYRLYPGINADMKSNFDVVRNHSYQVSLTLDSPSDMFLWDNTEPLVINKGETINAYFTTTLNPGTELLFSSSSSKFKFLQGHENYVEVHAEDDAPEGFSIITGRSISGDVSNSTQVYVPYTLSASLLEDDLYMCQNGHIYFTHVPDIATSITATIKSSVDGPYAHDYVLRPENVTRVNYGNQIQAGDVDQNWDDEVVLLESTDYGSAMITCTAWDEDGNALASCDVPVEFKHPTCHLNWYNSISSIPIDPTGESDYRFTMYYTNDSGVKLRRDSFNSNGQIRLAPYAAWYGTNASSPYIDFVTTTSGTTDWVTTVYLDEMPTSLDDFGEDAASAVKKLHIYPNDFPEPYPEADVTCYIELPYKYMYDNPFTIDIFNDVEVNGRYGYGKTASLSSGIDYLTGAYTRIFNYSQAKPTINIDLEDYYNTDEDTIKGYYGQSYDTPVLSWFSDGDEHYNDVMSYYRSSITFSCKDNNGQWMDDNHRWGALYGENTIYAVLSNDNIQRQLPAIPIGKANIYALSILVAKPECEQYTNGTIKGGIKLYVDIIGPTNHSHPIRDIGRNVYYSSWVYSTNELFNPSNNTQVVFDESIHAGPNGLTFYDKDDNWWDVNYRVNNYSPVGADNSDNCYIYPNFEKSYLGVYYIGTTSSSSTLTDTNPSMFTNEGLLYLFGNVFSNARPYMTYDHNVDDVYGDGIGPGGPSGSYGYMGGLSMGHLVCFYDNLYCPRYLPWFINGRIYD